MKIFETIERFKFIYKLIKEEQTGTANQFAQKVGISRSQLYNYLDYFKSYGIDIPYDFYKNSYVIENNNIEIIIHQPIQILKNGESITTNGGTANSDLLLLFE